MKREGLFVTCTELLMWLRAESYLYLSILQIPDEVPVLKSNLYTLETLQ